MQAIHLAALGGQAKVINVLIDDYGVLPTSVVSD